MTTTRKPLRSPWPTNTHAGKAYAVLTWIELFHLSCPQEHCTIHMLKESFIRMIRNNVNTRWCLFCCICCFSYSQIYDYITNTRIKVQSFIFGESSWTTGWYTFLPLIFGPLFINLTVPPKTNMTSVQHIPLCSVHYCFLFCLTPLVTASCSSFFLFSMLNN